MPNLPSSPADTRWDIDSPLGTVATTRAERRRVLKHWLDGVWAASDCGALVREVDAWSMWTVEEVQAEGQAAQASTGGARRRSGARSAAVGGRTTTRSGAAGRSSTVKSKGGAKGKPKRTASPAGSTKRASTKTRSARRGVRPG